MYKKCVLVVLIAEIFMLLGLCSPAFAAVDIGQPAPPLTAEEIDGSSFDLSKLQDKVVIVHFWATWCAPCRVEMPELSAFYRHYHGQGVEVIGISADRPHDRAAVKTVIDAFSFPAALLSDTKDNGFETPSTLPITYVVDRGGVIKAILTPETMPLTEQALVDIVKPLLAVHKAN